MQARLKVVQENASLKQVKLLPVTVIGRSAECHLKIASTEVSRKHCRITVTDRDVLIEDLNSSNGTYVDQRRIAPAQPMPVAPGAKLQIGPAAFVVDYTPPATLETMPTTVLKSADVAALAGAAIVTADPLSKFPVPPTPVEESAPPESKPTSVAAPAPAADETVNVLGDNTESVRTAKTLAEAKSSIVGNQPAAPPAPKPAIPVAKAAVAKPAAAKGHPVGKPVAKAVPVTAPPVALSMEPVAPGLAAEQTVFTPAPIREPAAPPPVSAPTVPPASGFDFLNSSGPPAANAASFDFDFGAPVATPEPAMPVPTAGSAAKGAADKKPLFGLFGKKKPAAGSPPASTAPVSPPTEPPAPVEQQIASPEEAAVEPPAEEPPAAEPTGTDDPFGFLKGM